MRRGHETLAFALALALLAGCSDPGSSPPASNVTDGWLGRWNGPEGTFLLLEGGNGSYEVTIQNLDGPRVFPAVGEGEQVRFERDGATEFIRATDGAATGMKWLSDKSNCLTVRSGEGYCRD
jgi:hypothetical protein